MMAFLVPARSYEPELMDGPGVDPKELERALRDLARVNRWLGGISSLWRPLARLLTEDRLRSFSLLDVGTGGGDVPRAIVARAGHAGLSARAAGVDLDATAVAYAATRTQSAGNGTPGSGSTSGGRGASAPIGQRETHRPVAFARADAFALPFADDSFDYVTSSMMFHHLREPEAAHVLGECARVARCAVLVDDLARHLVPWAFIKLLAPFAESSMVRHDGPLSVLRGWTESELLAVARSAGFGTIARVEGRFPYRIVLIVRTRSASTTCPPPTS